VVAVVFCLFCALDVVVVSLLVTRFVWFFWEVLLLLFFCVSLLFRDGRLFGWWFGQRVGIGGDGPGMGWHCDKDAYDGWMDGWMDGQMSGWGQH
jgi:hypothetical protein